MMEMHGTGSGVGIRTPPMETGIADGKTMSQALFYFLTLIGTKMNISPFKKEFKLRTEFIKIIRKVQESRKPRDIFSNF